MKKIISMMLALVLVLSLTACSGSDKNTGNMGSTGENNTGSEKTIYVIVKVLGNQYWSVVQAGAEKAGKDLGCNVVIVGTAAESDIEGQVRYLQDAVSANADAIVIAPLDRTALKNPISEQFKSGTPLVLIDSSVDGEDYSTALMTDNIEAGRMAAKEMIARLKAKGVPEDKEGSIAIQAGSTGSQAINDRLQGFNEYWDENAPTAWKVLKDDIKINDGDISKAVAFCQDFLTTYPDLLGVFGPNNGSTVGFVTGIMEANRTDLTMVGFDFSNEIETMIRGGEYDVASVVQRQYLMGYDGVKTALELANGGTVDEKIIDTGVLIVDNKNVDDKEVQEVINPSK
ncbi:ABC transporter substrate-binding protein [Clostridium sp. Marseille-P299]|uniref:ABC transporter substrate-binding protein n=1 Tax=Clostridium sp. Marseille-P299 TaxID=1805477 RepID=UPI0008340624|nr:ABC transporter substrate-binding protein [Clostridium sp. Marseille-P299]